MWLLDGRASVNESAAGWPVCWSRNSVSGFRPLAPVADISTKFAALIHQLRPCRSKVIGAASTPKNLPIKPERAAMGPPACPLAIAVTASRCSAVARAPLMSPTDQLPFPSPAAVRPRGTKPRPLHGTAASWPGTQGQTKSQLQVSWCWPLTFQEVIVTMRCPSCHRYTAPGRSADKLLRGRMRAEASMAASVSRRDFARLFAIGGSAALFADPAWAREYGRSEERRVGKG